MYYKEMCHLHQKITRIQRVYLSMVLQAKSRLLSDGALRNPGPGGLVHIDTKFGLMITVSAVKHSR